MSVQVATTSSAHAHRDVITSMQHDALLAQLEAEEAAGWPDLPDPSWSRNVVLQRQALTELLVVISNAICQPVHTGES